MEFIIKMYVVALHKESGAMLGEAYCEDKTLQSTIQGLIMENFGKTPLDNIVIEVHIQ